MKSRSPSEPPTRAYRSELREQHAAQTRERIFEAVAARIRKGDRELAYRSIAREARVAVATVYRHFPTHDDLYRALGTWGETRFGPTSEPRSLEDVPGLTREFFARFDDPDDPVVGAGRLNEVWRLSRAASVPHRRAFFETLAGREAPGLTERERRCLVDTCVVLFSAASGEAFRGYLERTGAETAEAVTWAITTLFAAAARKDER